MVAESTNTCSIYTIALFANTTYRILFLIHFIICSPALSILSPNQNEGPMEHKIYLHTLLTEPGWMLDIVPINKHKLNTSWILVSHKKSSKSLQKACFDSHFFQVQSFVKLLFSKGINMSHWCGRFTFQIILTFQSFTWVCHPPLQHHPV